MDHLLTDIASKYNLKRKNGKYVGPCPKCGGSKTSDKFNIRDDGGFKCYSCEFKGDIITWLREMEQMSCAEAHQAARIDCRSTTCQVADKCRLGTGTASSGGAKGTRRPYSVAPKTKTAVHLPTPSIKQPKDVWAQWAADLLEKSNKQIKENQDVIGWLADRGINSDAIARFRLGWLDHDRRTNRQDIGLLPKDGKNQLWVPGGLVIPIIDKNNSVHRLRIRRPAVDRKKFLEKLKYVWIEGSGTHPFLIRPENKPRGAVIVEAELDAMAVAAAHPEVMVVAIGTVAAGIPEPLRTELRSVPVILIALDADQAKTAGETGPGPKAAKIWSNTYRHARYWPVPSGKDPGDFAKTGNITDWIEAGLVPPVAQNNIKNQDLPLSPGCNQKGERGTELKKQPEKPIIVATPLDKSDYPWDLSKPAEECPLETEPDLKMCPICLGDLFLKSVRGGRFCVQCTPLSVPGKLVKAGALRGHYVVR